MAETEIHPGEATDGTAVLPDLPSDLSEINRQLKSKTAQQRVAWAVETFAPKLVLSSSFGAQSAVSLHMVSRVWPEIPVVLIDTGYLFPETYRFIDQLTERFQLNLQVYRAPLSPAWQEARYGRLWEQGLEGIERYNEMNKVEPMRRALRELEARAWIAGIRRQQSQERQTIEAVAVSHGALKIHPIFDWTDKDIHRYMVRYDLPYHPLWNEGYVSIGDRHTSKKLTDDMTEEETRFFGLKRECGLHEDVGSDYVI